MRLNINASALGKADLVSGIAIGPQLLAHYMYVKPVEKWWDQVTEQDRVWLYNKMELPAIQEPPLPTPPPEPSMDKAKRIAWITFGILMGLGILIGLIAAANPTEDVPDTPIGPWMILASMIFPGVIPAAITALIVRVLLTIRIRNTHRDAVWAYEAQQLQYNLWAFREQARTDLANGTRPIRYYEAIELHRFGY